MHRLNRTVVSVCAVVALAATYAYAQTPDEHPRSVVSWGSNSQGQAGPNNVGGIVETPQAVGLDNVIAVAGGLEQSYALTADGTVWGWGDNSSAQIGNRDAGPQPMAIVGGMKAIAAGSFHALALNRDGTVWAWGANIFGELGERRDLPRADNDPSYPTPQLVPGIDHVVAIAAGNFTSLALKEDGTVWGWGYNFDGEVGLGNPGGSVPRPIADLDHVVAIGMSFSNGIALKSDGSVWGWGDNSDGQIQSVTGGLLPPTQIVTGMVAIAAGTGHSLALGADGRVWGWGNNLFNRLGEDTGAVAPRVLLEETGIVALAAGAKHSLALTANGTIWKWGDGNAVPAPVPTDGTVVAIGAGWGHSLGVLASLQRRTPTIEWAQPAAITYGTALSAAQLNAVAIVDGEPVPGSFTYSLAAGTVLNAGTAQAIDVTFTPDDPSRYDEATASTTIDVNRAKLTVTAASASRVLGEPNPDFAVEYAGFVANEGPSVLSSPASVATSATAASAAGTYDITPSGAAAVNYDVSFVNGKLLVSYAVCALYDQTATRKSGSTVPIKLRLCDSAGRNVSSASVVLNATGLTRTSTFADALVVDDAGNANPDANFRSDGGLAGYIFNLKTTGLGTGTYQLEFTATGDPIAHRLGFRVR